MKEPLDPAVTIRTTLLVSLSEACTAFLGQSNRTTIWSSRVNCLDWSGTLCCPCCSLAGESGYLPLSIMYIHQILRGKTSSKVKRRGERLRELAGVVAGLVEGGVDGLLEGLEHRAAGLRLQVVRLQPLHQLLHLLLCLRPRSRGVQQ